eukprot:TRINITY_DN17781_c0_g1_i1.p1 TRINITY_DN17781_c0_g1~~TRINITY_DN17781_c0_g1_i1.p1  ORF type:complete len:542 (+),score=174.01 TRINITY_DN17781_c0_g1_i1:95-1627(+)
MLPMLRASLAAATWAAASAVVFNVNTPELPEDAGVYVAGSFQGWNPGDEAWRLTRASSTLYTITIPDTAFAGEATSQFKFTRGSWPLVEKSAGGGDVPNREYSFGVDPDPATFTVESFPSPATPAPTTGPNPVFTVTVPSGTPEGLSVYLAGAPNGWTAADPAYRFELVGGLTHRLELDAAAIGGSAFSFKFTLGSWDRVEKSADGSDAPNRVYTPGADPVEAAFTVQAWGSPPAPTAPATATGDITYHQVYAPTSKAPRGLAVYLPPGYAETRHRYPVLYLLDGENVFDEATASDAAEWGVDETLELMSSQSPFRGAIVVAIDSAGGAAARAAEYSPFNITYGGSAVAGVGAQFLSFLVDGVKPFIDASFRTQRGDLALGGSGLGATFSIWAALERADVFTRALALSPYLPESDFGTQMLDYIRGTPKAKASSLLLYMDHGDAELVFGASTALANAAQDAAAELAKVLPEGRMSFSLVEGGTHSPESWGPRFANATQWVYSDQFGCGEV